MTTARVTHQSSPSHLEMTLECLEIVSEREKERKRTIEILRLQLTQIKLKGRLRSKPQDTSQQIRYIIDHLLGRENYRHGKMFC